MKLILLEGVPGSGKTSLAKNLNEYFLGKNICSTYFVEGSKAHPVGLTWHAYLTPQEYETLLVEYTNQADYIKSQAIVEDDYVLVPYNKSKIITEQSNLLEYLKVHEICYSNKPIVTLATFTQVVSRHWSRFCQQNITNNGVIIFDGVFMQHQVHDLLRNYSPTNAQIINHLQQIANEILQLNPVIIYLSQNNVRETLVRASISRSQPQIATEEKIKFWENRKQIDLQALESLNIKSFIIDNSQYNWDKVLDESINLL